MKTFLLDVNVWIALTFGSHPHHPPAVRWFHEHPDSSIAFCRTTQQGFLRVATNRRAVEDYTMTLPEAWDAYDSILRDPRIEFLEEPMNLEASWRDFTDGETYSSKIWTDAYLAAFACAGDLHFITFDGGFDRYEGLEFSRLS